MQHNTKKAVIKFAAFVGEHNIPFNVMDHLSEIIRTSFPDSEIAKAYTSKRTKTTAIVTNVTGAHGFETTLNFLKTQKFSLIVDESTDKGTIKSLTLVCRVFNINVKDLFLALIPVAISSAEALYLKIKEFFVKY